MATYDGLTGMKAVARALSERAKAEDRKAAAMERLAVVFERAFELFAFPLAESLPDDEEPVA